MTFEGNTPQPNQASWYHADTSEGGHCSHVKYDASGRGHPGLVTVYVSDGYWTCTATYYGTQGDNGATSGTGDPPKACEHPN